MAKACAPQCFWSGLLLKELYPKAKGIPESRQVKSIGKPDALNAPVRFDVAGTGNEAKAVGLRTEAKATDYPPMPIVLAPVLDPTGFLIDDRNSFERARLQRAAKLAAILAGASPAGGNYPVATVAIAGDGTGDQSVESPAVKILDGWLSSRSDPTGG